MLTSKRPESRASPNGGGGGIATWDVFETGFPFLAVPVIAYTYCCAGRAVASSYVVALPDTVPSVCPSRVTVNFVNPWPEVAHDRLTSIGDAADAVNEVIRAAPAAPPPPRVPPPRASAVAMPATRSTTTTIAAIIAPLRRAGASGAEAASAEGMSAAWNAGVTPSGNGSVPSAEGVPGASSSTSRVVASPMRM